VVLCVCVSLFVGGLGGIGWLGKSRVTLKVACASCRWEVVGWSLSVCVGKDVFVSCE
jgi:hypothetical protein